MVPKGGRFEGSSVILNIKQGVSGVAGVAQSGLDLITNKREIETTVLVDNNQIIVLGGLIDEDTQEVISKVPVLGSIPLLGRLFQSTSSTTNKKNLMVFPPAILRRFLFVFRGRRRPRQRRTSNLLSHRLHQCRCCMGLAHTDREF